MVVAAGDITGRPKQLNGAARAADRAVLVALDLGSNDPAGSLAELRLLASSAGVDVRAVVQGRRSRPDPALFAGSGKVEEIARACAAHDARIVLFDHELSPAQQRNLDRGHDAIEIPHETIVLHAAAPVVPVA